MNNPCSRGEQAAHMDLDFAATLVFVRILLGAWSYIVNNILAIFIVFIFAPCILKIHQLLKTNNT
jgi:hypothetical protein